MTASRATRRWLCALVVLAPASCGVFFPGPAADRRPVDFTTFKQFRFWRAGGPAAFCLPGNSIYKATITLTQDGRYRLSLSVAQEVASAFDNIINCDPATGHCNVEVRLPPRDLARDEISRMSDLFAAIRVSDGGTAALCAVSCMTNHVAWDSSEFQGDGTTAAACAGAAGTIDPVYLNAVIAFLEELRSSS